MRRPDENTLLNWLDQQGIAYKEVDIDEEGVWGAYFKEEKLVCIQKGMSSMWRLATLIHECLHVLAGHDGHQSPRTEARINEQTARIMVDPKEYAFYENEWGWSTGGIADAMGLPRWVLEAYRAWLGRTLVL